LSAAWPERLLVFEKGKGVFDRNTIDHGPNHRDALASIPALQPSPERVPIYNGFVDFRIEGGKMVEGIPQFPVHSGPTECPVAPVFGYLGWAKPNVLIRAVKPLLLGDSSFPEWLQIFMREDVIHSGLRLILPVS
jgi:hypothetical protein